MGLDIGTTGTKAAVFDLEGRMLSLAYREYPLAHPGPGWIGLDAEQVWELSVQAVSQAAAESPDPVEALAVSCLGEAVVPVDAWGRPLALSMVGFDARGAEFLPLFEEAPGPLETFAQTGMPLNHTYTALKLLWLRRYMPEVFDAAERFLCYHDYFAARCGIEPVIDPSLGARTMMLELESRDWSPWITAKVGLGPERLARVQGAGTPAGELPKATTALLGLSPGAVLAVGGHDQACGALGAGIVHAGMACDSTGTVECLTVCFENPVLNPEMAGNNFCCYPHAAGRLFLTLAYNFTGGSLLRWFRDNLSELEVSRGRELGVDPYELILKRMSPTPSGVFVLPHFTTTGTPRVDPESTGAILGLGLDTTRPELIRGLLEGITLEIKYNMRLLEQVGVGVDEVRAIGGAARSGPWLQLKSDIFGKPVRTLAASESGCLGAAILAGVGAGRFRDAVEAAERIVVEGHGFEPDPEASRFYDTKLETYERIYPAIKNIGIGGRR